MLYSSFHPKSDFLWGGNIIIFYIFYLILPVLWIRIGSDTHIFAGSGSVLASRACRSGSSQSISIPINCIFYFAMKILICCPKYLKIMTHLPLMWKELYFNLLLLWIKVKKFGPSFFKMWKLREGSAFGSHYFDANPESRPGAGSASKWQVWSGSAFFLTTLNITFTIQYPYIW